MRICIVKPDINNNYRSFNYFIALTFCLAPLYTENSCKNLRSHIKSEQVPIGCSYIETKTIA